MNQKRKTVGAVAKELASKEAPTRSAYELSQAALKEWEQGVIECIDNNKRVFTGDFFVVVLTKRERLMHNVFRNFYHAQLSCPTPNYDQAVYRYSRRDDAVDFIWVIPDRETCHVYIEQSSQVHPEEYEFLKLIQEFKDGTLFELALKLNGEDKKDAIITINREL